MKGIIPTGGRGTRMRPLTFSANKHFIPVANKPLIFYPIETLIKAGVSDILITYNPDSVDQVKQILGDGSDFGAKFTYVLQEKPGGLANIVEVCEKELGGEKFVLHLGDNIFDSGVEDLVDFFAASSADALLTMVEHKDNSRLGVPFFDDHGKFIKYVEKPEDPPNHFGIPGLYFFGPKVFKAFRGASKIVPSERGELEIGSLYNFLIDHGYKVETKEYMGKWLDPGKFGDWIDANQYLLDAHLETDIQSQVDETSLLENRVKIGKNCQIINSNIRGPASIGNGVQITDSFIGPFTSIADDCQIIESHVGNSVLMNGVKIIGVAKQVDSSLVGTETEIVSQAGPNSAIKLFVGEKCQIGI